jgi:hypothetical protein
MHQSDQAGFKRILRLDIDKVLDIFLMTQAVFALAWIAYYVFV